MPTFRSEPSSGRVTGWLEFLLKTVGKARDLRFSGGDSRPFWNMEVSKTPRRRGVVMGGWGKIPNSPYSSWLFVESSCLLLGFNLHFIEIHVLLIPKPSVFIEVIIILSRFLLLL